MDSQTEPDSGVIPAPSDAISLSVARSGVARAVTGGMSRSLLKFARRPLPMALYAAAAFDAMGVSTSFCLCNAASASRSFGNCL